MQKILTILDKFLFQNNLNPYFLLIIIFVIALSKSTIFFSSCLPPASVLILSCVSIALTKINIALIILSITVGATLGSILSYYAGKLISNKKIFLNFLNKNSLIINKSIQKIKKKRTLYCFYLDFLLSLDI